MFEYIATIPISPGLPTLISTWTQPEPLHCLKNSKGYYLTLQMKEFGPLKTCRG